MASKRFAPSAKKLKKAREDGDVAKSKDLTSALQLICGFSFLLFVSSQYEKLLTFFVDSFSLSPPPSADPDNAQLWSLLHRAESVFLWVVLPFLGIIVIVVLIAEIAQVGLHLSPKAMTPKFSKLNPVEGFKRILGIQGGDDDKAIPTALLYEITKLSAYILTFSALSFACIYKYFPAIMEGQSSDMGEVIASVKHFAISLVYSCLGLISVFASADLMIQRKRRTDRLKMDVEEMKREFKDSEGDPEVKGQRKQLHREVLVHGLTQAVRKAKVLITGK